ncbi:MAG: zinc-dependent alcohol dehydrogenase family protein [Chloroflexi bacterium]|nr:zinc-dependent alcohol dehydrogenase family protein [Chloroflexota bacterium]OJV99735.1 MAG: quinone oxidoreductase [Chloroflexi bacterium 54-19]
MKAQIIRSYGGPEVFETADIPRPEVKPGHIIISVAATSINPVDYKVRQHGPGIAPELPAVLHGDVAGTVAEVGEGVTRFKVGDEVYACAGGVRGTGGALAEYMLADAGLVALKPQSLTMAEAAALPLVVLTAWEGLVDQVKIEPGQTILVHAATGGVGHIVIQLAKAFGAKVFATASSDKKLEIGRGLGADVVINYKTTGVEEYVKEYTGGKGFDIVFDTVGGKNLEASFQAVRIHGQVASNAAGGSHDLSALSNKAANLHVVFMLLPMLTGQGRAHHGEILTEVAKLVDAGKVRPLVDPRQFTFEEVAEAHRYAESGNQVGKVVLTRA